MRLFAFGAQGRRQGIGIEADGQIRDLPDMQMCSRIWHLCRTETYGESLSSW